MYKFTERLASFPPSSVTKAHGGWATEHCRLSTEKECVAIGEQFALIGLCCLDAVLGPPQGKELASKFNLIFVEPPAQVDDGGLRFFLRPPERAGNSSLLEALLYFAASVSRSGFTRESFTVGAAPNHALTHRCKHIQTSGSHHRSAL